MEKKKLKIVFLNIYQGSVNRGAETFTEELSKKLEKYFDLEVISGKRKLIKRLPVIWRFFLDPQGMIVFWWSLRMLPRVIRERPDIIIPLNGGWQALLMRFLTWAYGGKLVIVGQSGIGWDDRVNLWSMPNHFVGISKKASLWSKKVNPMVSSQYIPNGVDLEKFKPGGRVFQHGLKGKVILCVGALVPSKQIDKAILAVSKLKQVSLLIAGDGPQNEGLLALGRESLGRRRFKLVSVTHEMMPEIYRSADIFVFTPERSEAFGIVYVEAMASGLSVVATDDPIRREIVGNAGLFVDPNNMEEYARIIRRALEMKWGNKPRIQAQKYSWDKIAEKYEKLFSSLYK
ncbi:MAG: Glycosyl transferase, group 1 [Candidatus Woesebacteria bacterium GW2011_GWB1_43_14]|uniref:Glycosyl transferase, group 1 n=1 Tax=Candidatus Woesebacteria bacterium GW2011_GWB1_43_14 TaxID=1618578 RepID=A0A0G1DI03_9BACT|nr:MAG: Glycosyl transferase, group 1 [Candidatus Woesebacteria bacterium GW2011_GWA1_39_11b]KKS78396.1 MAG: Glycosyl transferase, group 1 [Candidatus Woesebacteria bacterium GW2011_GWC1_42_9]KKS97187.1 MAG: Glycosyl transferase, group 1 [Candidatus Woesebacteria bacterium GW2011_GWB1_43_14]